MLKLGIVVLAFSSSLALASERCEYSSEQQLTLKDVQHLQLTMRSDQLQLVGGSGDQVEVTARLCASSKKRLEAMALQPKQQSGVAQLRLLPEQRSSSFSAGWFGRKNEKYSRFELTIAAPTAMLLDLTVSSGTASIENIAGLELTLSSGRVQAATIPGLVSSSVSSGQFALTDAGPVQLTNLSSGQVRLSQVGSVQASRVSSGQLRIEEAAGDVRLDSLSSGQIRVSDVLGSVQIGRVSSGSARVSDVQGNAEFGSIGSGSIRAERIGGDLSLDHKGSGSVRYQDVRGQVRLPSR